MHHIEALVDTGFSGDLVLPNGFFPDNQEPDSYSAWTVADGRRVTAAIYYGLVRIGDYPAVEAAIILLGDKPIIGRSITNRYRVIFDHGRRVIVEP